MVYRIAAALRIGRQGFLDLMDIAFPEMFEALDREDPPSCLNITLTEKGKPPL